MRQSQSPRPAAGMAHVPRARPLVLLLAGAGATATADADGAVGAVARAAGAAAGASARSRSPNAADTADVRPGSPAPMDAKDVAAVLARPVSPGSIALLVEHATDPAAQARLSEALKDSRSEVRAVAARVTVSTKLRVLADLQAALAQERDEVAAAELVRAVMTLGGSTTYANAVSAAVRVRGLAVDAAVETFARLGARELLTHVGVLLGADTAREPLAKAIMTVTKGDSAARAAVLREPVVVNDALVRNALLCLMRADGEPVPAAAFVAWLGGDDEALRVDTIWQIAQTIAERGATAIPAEVMTALAPRLEANKTQVSWEALGLELIARMTGRPAARRSWRTLAKPRLPVALTAARPTPEPFDQLTDTEREEISEVMHGRRDALDRARPMPPDSGSKPAERPPVRSIPPFVGALWQDLYTITGCKPRDSRVALGQLAYHPEGRPRLVSIQAGDLSEGCQTMARTLFSLTLAPVAEPTSATYVEIGTLPLTDGVIACASERPVAPDRTRRPGMQGSDVITPPTKIRDVRPVYPESAIHEGVQGIVIVEATISSSGCVTSARVTRSVDLRLDIQAITAVTAWRYRPTLLNNEAVPVIMTVTVNFTLR